jgi:hypothetical protein
VTETSSVTTLYQLQGFGIERHNRSGHSLLINNILVLVWSEKKNNYGQLYRVIYKSRRDFRPLLYSSREGHAGGGGGGCQQRERHSKFLSYLTGARYVHPWSILVQVSRTRSTVSADDPGRPVRFTAHRQPLCCSFVYHSRTDLSVGGSVWYMVRNLRCTVIIDSVLANSKTQNSFLSPVHAIFRHDCPLAAKPASTPCRLLPK